MRVSVTAEHIARGCPEEGTRCPIALAVQEATGRETIVDGSFISCYTSKGLRSYRAPREVQKFICNFDAGRSVFPSTFIIPGLTRRQPL